MVEPVAPGDNVERRGAVAAAGAPLVAIGIRLALRHIGMLAAAEIDTVQVVRRPRVEILLAGPMAAPHAPDSNGPMLRAAVERDGGVIVEVTRAPRARSSLNTALDRGEWGSCAGNRRDRAWTRRPRRRGAR